MRREPFVARWQLGPIVDGGFEACLALDDPGPFEGHYPSAPVFPGAFLLEAFAQAARTAIGGSAEIEEIAACRFHSPLLPGDRLVARFTLKPVAGGGTLVEAKARGRAEAAEARLRLGPAALASPIEGARRLAPSFEGTPARVLDAAFIASALPHRPPALLVDSASLFDPSGSRPKLLARGLVKPVDSLADARRDPAEGRLPRFLALESFCQSCGLLRSATGPAETPDDGGRAPVVAKLVDVRFWGDVAATDILEHQVELLARTEDGAVFAGQSTASGRPILQVARVVAALAPLPPRAGLGPPRPPC